MTATSRRRRSPTMRKATTGSRQPPQNYGQAPPPNYAQPQYGQPQYYRRGAQPYYGQPRPYYAQPGYFPPQPPPVYVLRPGGLY